MGRVGRLALSPNFAGFLQEPIPTRLDNMMARIRTIKPEFPQSESMGNVSRDARLTFILLWTLADDEGRLRGNSRMLASLLFPYDDGENGHPDTKTSDVERWLTELEREQCIVRYQGDGASYVGICKWLIHQKIDKPSKSKIPEFSESSRIVANHREVSSEEGIKDQGSRKGSEGNKTTVPPSGETAEVFAYWQQKMGHPQAKLDAKRSKAISGRLKDGYIVGELCEAIDGCLLSPHHMGQNETRTVYDDIELICRDGPRVDKFIKLARQGGTQNQLQAYLDDMDAWAATK